MNMRATDFHFFLKSVGQQFTSLSIFNSDFKCLHIQTPFNNNSVGLMTGLKTLKPFFPWDGSQIIMHNDPLLGCSRSDRIQFLFSVDSFHFCIEEPFNLPWNFSQKITKIPPVPLVENQRLNTPLVEALTHQADCPVGLREFLNSILKKIEDFQLNFKNVVKANPELSNKDLHKKYLLSSASSTLKTIKSKTYTSTNIEYEFDSISFLKLKTSTSELGIRIDFQGTTNHPLIQMADSITDSICFNFFADYFQFADMLNEATFSNFQISKPTQSFVNSKVFENRLYSDIAGLELLSQALLDSSIDRTTLKPYLYQKPHLQMIHGNNNLEFYLPNSKPMGSMGVSYNHDPLLSSRPTANGSHVPDFEVFKKFGFDICGSQLLFRTSKAKEINDFQSLFHMSCQSACQLAIINPHFPTKMKPNKSKATLVRPVITINGTICDRPFEVKTLSAGDIVVLRSGSIDFS